MAHRRVIVDTKIKLILTYCFLFATLISNAQNCDCKSNFEWVKKTFEENDAGFEYALKTKGQQAYSDHTKRISEKVQNAKTINECGTILYEWLTFFRSGHIAISLSEQIQFKTTIQNPLKHFPIGKLTLSKPMISKST